jgi:hypothetical protein
MALIESFPGPSGVVDTVELRKDLAGLIVRTTTGVARAGVFPRHTNALVTARASMGVDVAAFEAALVRGGGPLFIANDGTVTVPIGAAPASNSRYDVVYVKQNESVSPFADANNTPIFGFVSGAAAASPSLSAAVALVPAGALALASVLVPSTATTTQSSGVVITQQYQYTCGSGGTLLFRNTTERDMFDAGDGQKARLLDSATDWTRTGGAWVQDQALFGSLASVTTLVGGTVPAGAKIYRQTFLGAATTNTSGDASLVYPTPFPSGVISAVVTRHNFGTLGPTAEVLNTTQSVSQLNLRIFDLTGAAVTTVLTFGYTVDVVGW